MTDRAFRLDDGLENPYLKLLSYLPLTSERFWSGQIPLYSLNPSIYDALPKEVRAQFPLAYRTDQLPGRRMLTDYVSIDRFALVNKFAWAIPSDEVVYAIAKHTPIVEVCAGNGYWAWLLRQAGADVIATDKTLRPTSWSEVIEMPAHEAASKYSDRTLFICWPPYADAAANRALRAYRGDRVIYIGEGNGGCTGNDAFHTRLDKSWVEVKTMALLQYEGIHDRVMFFERKPFVRSKRERKR